MSAVNRLYNGLHALLGGIVAAAILFVAVGISIDVIIRNSGLGVLSWMLEATEYSLFVATFLGAPWVLHLGEHVRIDMLVRQLPPRAGRIAEILTDVAGLAVSLVLLYYSTSVALGSRSDGSLVIKELIFPEWWIFAVVVASALMLCLEFVIRLWKAVMDSRFRPDLEHGHGGF
jgi:TRAP-type C4-dicarboxylate transport system permease small subunit